MKIALFAACEVGYEIVKFFHETNEEFSCLVLDAKDKENINKNILDIAKNKEIIYSDHLYKKQSLDALQQMHLDLIILAWWPYIIKENIIKIPKLGCLNFHPSFLPFNRGKHPNFWSLVEDVPYGVSIHFVENQVDSGDIAFQEISEKTWEDTGKSLHEKGKREIVNLFKKNFPRIKNEEIPKFKQDLTEGSFHKSGEIDQASRIKLDEKYEVRHLLNILRARTFPPYPAAWFMENGQKFEVRVEIKKVNE